MTIKETKLVQLVAQGKRKGEAYKEAYNDRGGKLETARVEAHKTLQKPDVKAALDAALAAHDINLDNALKPIAKGLKAEKMNEYTGEVTEDLNLQLKASDRALRLLGVNGENTGTFHLHLHANKEKYDL